MALIMIMVLDLLVYSLAERKLRLQLSETGQSVLDQVGKETQNPCAGCLETKINPSWGRVVSPICELCAQAVEWRVPAAGPRKLQRPYHNKGFWF